jgi:hypothetical protein
VYSPGVDVSGSVAEAWMWINASPRATFPFLSIIA